MNIKIWSATAALALTLAAGSAQASVGTPLIAAKAASSQGAPKAAGQKRYCVIDTVTGSRLPRKKCLTRQEWLAQGVDPLAPND